jgi:Glycosyl transferases group 1
VSNLTIAYLGNFRTGQPPSARSTSECAVIKTLRETGHTVVSLDEALVTLPDILTACRGADLFLWTKTGGWLKCNGHEMISRISIPTVALHLDLYWGLEREKEITTDAFWKVKYSFTADGGNQEKFKAAGVNHFWLRPGVLKSECYLAEPIDDINCDIGFVGSANYHKEWYREKLVNWLKSTYGKRFRVFGSNGDSWRGNDLNRLYASVKCIVGDSCFAGKLKNYVSDRLVESCGRGAAMVFPVIEGMTGDYTHEKHLMWYTAGDFTELAFAIGKMLAAPEEARRQMRLDAIEHTKQYHTWDIRLNEMLSVIAKHEPEIAARMGK